MKTFRNENKQNKTKVIKIINGNPYRKGRKNKSMVQELNVENNQNDKL